MRRAALIALAAAAVFLGMLLLPAPRAHASTTPHRLTALHWAYSQHGCWYQWGGTGPCGAGYDCSGLVYESYLHAGIRLGRDTYAMLAEAGGKLIREPVSAARPGDLLFYGSGHVELATDRSHVSYGAQQQGTPVGWHPWGGGWSPSMAFRVR